uniref:Uncharacterized protein n=1 Tax=Physcomitrium patens TaxID=3218 RepID=A0A2K1JGT5_PHYPA|nr:hypothetical protein PHYPA_018177 [Physcomitrium patens]
MQVLCIKDGICQKRYVKEYQEVISIDGDGSPQYCKKNDGRTFNISNHIINNQDIVSYNLILKRKHNCHIKIEICASI